MPPEPSQLPGQMPSVSPDNNPYDFIVSSQNNGKGKKLNLKGSNKIKFIVLAIALLISVVVVAGVLVLLLGGDKGGISKLNDLVARQAEIARVSGMAVENGGKFELRYLASTTKATLASDQKSIIDSLDKAYNERSSIAYRDKKIDDQLKDAQNKGNFDQVYYDWMFDKMKAYYSKLQETSKTQGLSKESKFALKISLSNAEIIIKNLKPSSPSITSN